jgi:hypothetical protein
MPRPGQQLSVLVSSHFLSSLFNDAAQWITSNLYSFEKVLVTLFYMDCPLFFFDRLRCQKGCDINFLP